MEAQRRPQLAPDPDLEDTVLDIAALARLLLEIGACTETQWADVRHQLHTMLAARAGELLVYVYGDGAAPKVASDAGLKNYSPA